MWWAILSQTFETLRANKLRSFLTMFGVSWGVLSLILMTSLGEGFRLAQQRGLRNLGINIMIIWGGRTSHQSEDSQAGRRIRLTRSDYEEIRDKARLIQRVSPELIRGDLVAKTPINNGVFSVHGIVPDYQPMRSVSVSSGRLINFMDEAETRTVCILGSEVNTQLFNDQDSVGQTVSIGNRDFTVIGVMPFKDQNNSYSGQDRRSIFIPYGTLRKVFSDPSLGESPDLIDNLIAQPISLQAQQQAELEVRQILAEKNRFDAEDTDALPIWNTARQSLMMDTLFRSMQWFLGSVAVVTLALGAIGVINIMLISVRERTVEIGLRKSLGARRRDILGQFFAESFLLTTLSGMVGVAIGWGLCQLINQLPLPEMVFAGMIITPSVAYIAFGTLAVLGTAAAIYPAFTAADLDPIEALRFEAN